jgi:hypothetical protein
MHEAKRVGAPIVCSSFQLFGTIDGVYALVLLTWGSPLTFTSLGFLERTNQSAKFYRT